MTKRTAKPASYWILAFAAALLALLLSASASASKSHRHIQKTRVARAIPACRCGNPLNPAWYPYSSFVSRHVHPVADPFGTGRAVLQYSIANSDQPYPGASPRGDLEGPQMFFPGSDEYFAIPVLIPARFPRIPNKQWVMFAEIYGTPYEGAPTIALSIRNDFRDHVNHFAFGGYVDGRVKDGMWYSPRLDGRWHTFILHVHFATDQSGSVQLWYDGKRQRFRSSAWTVRYPTMVPGRTWDGTHGNFLDINNYRPKDLLSGTLALYHGVPVVGPTLASVASYVQWTTREP